jgi:hypothetical protein
MKQLQSRKQVARAAHNQIVAHPASVRMECPAASEFFTHPSCRDTPHNTDKDKREPGVTRSRLQEMCALNE